MGDFPKTYPDVFQDMVVFVYENKDADAIENDLRQTFFSETDGDALDAIFSVEQSNETNFEQIDVQIDSSRSLPDEPDVVEAINVLREKTRVDYIVVSWRDAHLELFGPDKIDAEDLGELKTLWAHGVSPSNQSSYFEDDREVFFETLPEIDVADANIVRGIADKTPKTLTLANVMEIAEGDDIAKLSEYLALVSQGDAVNTPEKSAEQFPKLPEKDKTAITFIEECIKKTNERSPFVSDESLAEAWRKSLKKPVGGKAASQIKGYEPES